MSKTPRILLTGPDRRDLQPIAERLEALGFTLQYLHSSAAALTAAETESPAAILLDVRDGEEAESRRFAAACRERLHPRPPVIALWPAHAPAAPIDAFQAVLRDPVHPAQAAARIQNAVRLGVMEAEAALRLDSLKDFGVRPPAGRAQEPEGLNILFVGDAHPAFMGLKTGLQRAGVNVAAAFTSFSAFDYMHDRDFHAVVLNALGRNEPAFTICAAMRRNTRLYHVPALILRDPARFDAADEAFARGASDLLDTGAPDAETVERVLSLARERRRTLAVRKLIDSGRAPGVLDRETELFNRDFLAAHLSRMTRQSHRSGQPLALLLIRAAASVFETPAPTPERLAEARRDFGMMLRHLIRAEDFAGRLDENLFALAMPVTTGEEAETIAKRVEMVAECSAFAEDTDPNQTPVRLYLRTASLQLEPEETAPAFLKRAFGALTGEPASRPLSRGRPAREGLS